MRKFCRKKIPAVLALCILVSLIFMPSDVSAETVVNNVPIYRREDVQRRPAPARENIVQRELEVSEADDTEKIAPAPADESKQEVSEKPAETTSSAHPKQEEKQPLENPKPAETETQKPSKPEVATEKDELLETKDTKNETLDYANYFKDFIMEKPTFNATYGDGGDLAKLSSNLSCGSVYRVHSDSSYESVYFDIRKSRLAWAFGADTSVYFSVSTHLRAPIVISKKRIPYFEIVKYGKKTVFNLPKMTRYQRTRFVISTGIVHFLDDLFVDNAEVFLVLYVEGGEYIRVPISSEALKMWKEVTDADLKKMRKEYEDL